MSDYSKPEQSWQHAVESLDEPSGRVAWPLCRCGKPAKYEVNRITSVEFVCAEHVPEGL